MDLSVPSVYPRSYLSMVWTDALTQNFTLIFFTTGRDILRLLHKVRPCSPIWLFLLLIKKEKECWKGKMGFKIFCDTAFDKWQSTTAFRMENKDLAALKKIVGTSWFDNDVFKIIIMFHFYKAEVISWDMFGWKEALGLYPKKLLW